MITRLEIPYFAERILGVTIPEKNTMYACSYSGLHTLLLDDIVHVETDEEQAEDYDLLKSKGEALGIFGGSPILENSKTKIYYTFDPRAATQRIEVLQTERKALISFTTMSGDWFFASLSKCGDYLLLAEPYAIQIYKIA